ncbi:hypothetical protein [Kitasatospora viridis]|uniref:Uncharacterized protein n=1 Tax=Kitasatospora viridis TaxID=281105 RepID=A0A561S9X4_9ACTN|nr:hypothetical protein [Kitasatospora viridis]TWF71678.1 hypothetical protein FHX73_1849 [Kitasatospora viridis]
MSGPNPIHNIVGVFSVNGVQTPAGMYLPSDHGLLAWNYDPSGTSNSSATVSGTVYLAQVILRTPQTVSKAILSLTGAASGVVANQNFIGLYDSSGNRVAVTAAGALDAALTSSGTLPGTFTSPYAAAAGAYWVAFVNNATTPAQLGRASGFSSTPNANLAAAQYRYCTNGTGQTALPSSITPSSNSLANVMTFWAGLG